MFSVYISFKGCMEGSIRAATGIQYICILGKERAHWVYLSYVYWMVLAVLGISSYSENLLPLRTSPPFPATNWVLHAFSHILYTAVSTKVVPQKRLSVRDNADWYYG